MSGAPTRPALTAIVCTHERPDDLARCLEALCRLEDEVELIVVDSASTPPVRPLVERYRDRLPGLHYLYVERPGLSAARNAGLAAAAGELVAFLDDDTQPAPDWAGRVRAAFARDPLIGCVGGTCRAFLLPGTSRPPWLSDRLLCFAGITNFGREPREPRSSGEWPFGANMAYRRDLLAAHAFDEALGRSGSNLNSGEDSDMVARVVAGGWKVWLEPAALVEHTVHDFRLESGYYWRRLWAQGRSRADYPAGRTLALAARLAAAAPLRLGLYVLTRDRVYLYRLAETAGFFAARLRALHAPARPRARTSGGSGAPA